jgi:two-component system, OmpR family, response regulator
LNRSHLESAEEFVMTVTPIHGHPNIIAKSRQPRSPGRSGRGGHGTAAAAVIASPPKPGSDDQPEWTLTLDIRVSGSPDPAILELVADLQRLIGRDANGPPVDGRTVRIDPAARTVSLSGRPITLSRLEFNLLLFLAENPGRVFTRERLLHEVWGDERSGTRTVDVHVRRLRAKVAEAPVVTTVRSVGYRLTSEARVHIVRS